MRHVRRLCVYDLWIDLIPSHDIRKRHLQEGPGRLNPKAYAKRGGLEVQCDKYT